jgi:hypothetical protein
LLKSFNHETHEPHERNLAAFGLFVYFVCFVVSYLLVAAGRRVMTRTSVRFSPLLGRLVSLALIFLIVLMLLPVQPARAELIVNGNITENTSWSGSVRVTYPISLNSGVRLVIQPGTIIRFDAGTGIDCYGQMLSLGEISSPVVFTSDVGNWRGLKFLDDDIVYGPSELWGTIIEMGGTQGGSVMIDNAQVTIANSEFRDGLGDGVIGYAKGTAIITNTLITRHVGYAFHFNDPTIDPQLAYLRATDNGHNVIVLGGGSSYQFGSRLWENAGLPYEIHFTGFNVAQGETLTIEPGVTLRFIDSSSLYVAGRLIAAGTPEQPITFSAVNATPGIWQGINIIGTHDNPATAVISHATIEYAGSGPSGGNLRVEGANVAVEYSRIQHGAAFGAHVGSGGVLKINASQITDNALGGVKTLRNDIDVIARNNWWGHASGPLHPTTNPGGLGNSVSDKVLYNPWLSDPSLAGPEATRPAELQVQVIGNANFVPGSRQTYALNYRNGTASTITNAVLVAWLPDSAYYLYSGGGIYWANREQVFWKLGDLPPGTEGIVAFSVEYAWGIPFGVTDAVVAAIAGSNAPSDLITVSDYLAYIPPVLTRTSLTQSEANTLLAGNGEAQLLYNQAVNEGFRFIDAYANTRSDGKAFGEINLLKLGSPLTYQSVIVHATNAVAQSFNSEGYTVRTSASKLFFDPRTQNWTDQTPTLQLAHFGPNQAASSFSKCMSNCTQQMLKSSIFGKLVPLADNVEGIASCVEAQGDPGNTDAVLGCGKAIGSKIPVIGDAIDYGTELGKCNVACQADPNSHVCTEDIYECNNSGFYVWLTGGAESLVRRCNTETGMYYAQTSYQKCAIGGKCVLNDGVPSCQGCATLGSTQPTGASSELRLKPAANTSAEQPGAMLAASNKNVSCPFCSPAQDPNAKLGVEGLVAPGQTLAYTVQYENVGAGQAFGVFVMDKLSTAFDETTLALGTGGKYLPASRTILWDVGELAAKGQPGSKGEFTFTVKLHANLPTGTVVTNQATVYFPSVPEITPTNAVVNIVQPVVGSDQKVSTLLNQPVSFELRGFSAAGGTLSYQVMQPPSFGKLSGTPPNLTYTPMAGYSGPDHLYFTIGNGTETSLPAQVVFDVMAEKIYLPLLIR